jgi:hypothetical protein
MAECALCDAITEQPFVLAPEMRDAARAARSPSDSHSTFRPEGRPLTNRRLLLPVLFAATCVFGGCVVYEPVPFASPPQSAAQRFDRSWNAATGELVDQGLTIVAQDRDAVVIRGTRGDITIVATLQTLADGRVQVKFGSTGATDKDPGLIHRVSESYERRMGR